MDKNLPEVGARVVTADGHLVGTVAAVVEPCFKLDRPMAPDKWLAIDLVTGIDRDVRLSMTREEFEGGREGIEHFGYHVHHEN